MISSEKAFDLLPDMIDVFDKLELKEQMKILKENSDGKSKEEVGIELIKCVLKNSGKVKKEFFSIVAIIEDKSIEEIKEQNFLKTISSLKTLFEDKEFMSFFTSAMK